ncbi:hypothetical protein OAC89_03175 [Deltaproteobacteria bacterium]|nr:hypothetical protein [Deltaproteobacteria bacterium]
MPLNASKWLPGSSTQRTKLGRTVSEIIPCFYIYNKKKKVLCAGEKSINFPSNKAISAREWQSALSKSHRKNPILEGKKYLSCLEINPNFKYQNVANKFNVSKARVSQMIALVKKLPTEIIDYLINQKNPEDVKYFTERRLRPLTLMGPDEEKIKRFWEMANNILRT